MTAAVLAISAGAIAARKVLIPLTHQAGSTYLEGNTYDVSGKMGGVVTIRFGRRSASAAGAGAKIIIQVSPSSDGAIWHDLFTYVTDFAACASQAVSVSSASGQKVVSVAATANFPVQTPVFIANNSAANSEWGITTALSTNTSITLRDNLDYTQGTSSTLYTAAEVSQPIKFPAGVARIRGIFDGLGFTQNCAFEAWYTSIDSIG